MNILETQNYLLDACSMIAFLEDEPGAEKLNEILDKAAQLECIL